MLRARIAVVALAFGATAQAATLYVAPDGSDSADGRWPVATAGSGPLASPKAAVHRMGRPGAGDDDPVDRIILLPGTYVLDETLVIDRTARPGRSKPLVIMARDVGSVTLSGGSRLPPFVEDGEGWRSQLPVAAPVQDLWVDERRAVLARSPNTGGWYRGGRNTSRPAPESSPLRVSKPENIDNTRRLVLEPAAQAVLRQAQPVPGSGLEGVHFVALHSWASSRQWVERFEADSGTLSVSPNGRWPFFRFEPDQRYAFENHPSFLDAPGEWWAAADGSLRYLPREGDHARTAVAVVPRLETLISIRGQAGDPLRSIILRGLRLRHTLAVSTPFVDGQGAIATPAALVADQVQGLEVDQCEFAQLGGYAVWLRRGVTDSRVRRSHFHDLGAGGIRVGEAAMPAAEADRTVRNVVENNLVEDGGVTFASGVGIWVGQSGANRIVNNEVRDLNYTGISVGWTWGFGPSDARQNLIAQNEVHDIGRGILNDLGGIYTLGPTAGTRVLGNRIARVTSYRRSGGSTAFGIYLDEGSSDVIVEGNLVMDTTGGGLHLNYGRNDTVRRNIFVGGLLAQAKRARRGLDAALVFERNVLVGDGPDLYQGEWNDPDVQTRANVLRADAGTFRWRGLSLEQLQAAGRELGSVAGDPSLQCDLSRCTIDAALAGRIGFEPLSFGRTGIVDRGAMLPR